MASESKPENSEEAFVALLTASQDALYRYILTLVVGQHDRARDILQETNLVIWRKSSEFRLGTDFNAWARRIAHYRVMTDLRDAERKPLMFSEKLIDALASDYEQNANDVELRQGFLQECFAALPSNQSQLVRSRYAEDQSIAEISRQQGRSANAISAALYRIRLVLLDCVNRKVAKL